VADALADMDINRMLHSLVSITFRKAMKAASCAIPNHPPQKIIPNKLAITPERDET
jgi:hypothetical protein